MPIKVLLAEDHEKIRDAVSRHLSSDPEIEVIAVTRKFTEAMELCSQLRPDIVLMDLHMPDERSITPEQVNSGFSQSKLIAMSIWNDDEAKSLADSFGAKVLLDKTSLVDDLIPAIKLCAKI
jgi:DNA-binding NarL/FixJ family response regulator